MSTEIDAHRQAVGAGWAVASPHAAATEAAARIYQRGGNAIDAAVAAAAVLTVVYPNQCSVGGDLLALVADPSGAVTFVNGSGRSARGTDVSAITSAHTTMPVTGALPVTVPGAVGGWAELNERWGRLTLADCLADARSAAADGIPVSPGLSRDLQREAAVLATDPSLRRLFAPEGTLLGVGQTLRQPELAASLSAIAAEGASALYGGELGRSLVKHLAEFGSYLTLDDFAEHRTTSHGALSTSFAGEEYLSSGANSQGLFFLEGLAALEILRQQGHHLDPVGDTAGPIAAVLSQAAQDRDSFLGDPDGVDVPTGWLLSDERATELAAAALVPDEPRARTQSPIATGDTVAVVAADRDGNRISLIQSLFHAFGAGILDPMTGILLHNRGASFNLSPRSPNRLAGGRRPLHTLMPVLVRRGGSVVGTHGTMGGRAQPQVHTHLALRLAAGAGVQQAVAGPRWVLGPMEAGGGHASPFDVVMVESDVPERTVTSLQRWGLRTGSLPPRDDGVGHAQLIRWQGGAFHAATDPRADGSAMAQ
jgi:gamma-glutamyltranspeptidase